MTLKPGDQVWVGPAEFDGYDRDGYPMWTSSRGNCIPDVPHLAHIARYLADHPETVDALGTAVVGLAHLANNAATPKEYSRFLEALGSVRGLIAAMRGEGGE